jgi:predicted dehydrogenase
MTLRLGLVGCGGMGRRHVGGMGRLKAAGRLSFDLVSVCDVLPENAKLAADRAEEVLGRRPQIFTDFEGLLASKSVDAIIVTTTPETHAEIGLQAFAAGLDVMVEKPITLTAVDGRKLVAGARASGRKLAVAENYRRDPINRLGQALIEAGAIGQPFMATQSSSSSGEFVIITPWRHRRDRGGIVIDMGVHYTDILEFYLGPIDTVFGMNAVVDAERVDKEGARHPADAEDLSVGVMRFRSGAIANWLLSLAGRGESSFTRIFYGKGGSLSVPGDRSGKALNLIQRRAGADEQVPPAELLKLVPSFALDATTAALFGGERLATYALPWTEIDANLLGIEQADFAEAIAQNREPDVNGEQGLRSLALVVGLLESEQLGRAVQVDELLHPSANQPAPETEKQP